MPAASLCPSCFVLLVGLFLLVCFCWFVGFCPVCCLFDLVLLFLCLLLFYSLSFFLFWGGGGGGGGLDHFGYIYIGSCEQSL